MNKEIYLIRGFESESYKEFSDRITQVAVTISGKTGSGSVKIVYTVEQPPTLSVIPFQKKKAATVSIYRNDPVPMDILIRMKGFSGAYRVTEALPVAYRKTWPDGEITPGICLLTLFNRKKGLDDKTFLDRWHNSHTPLSLRIHPLWNYSRNVVDEILTETSEKFEGIVEDTVILELKAAEGIVEEQMRSDSELLNPFRFFGNPLVIIQRMIAVYSDTKSFLDYGNIETYLAREVVVKS